MTEAEFQSLLGWLGELTTEQVTTLRQALRRRDGLAQVAAIFERGQDGACPPCVHCGGESRRWGHVRGLRRFRCAACGRTFTTLTNSPLSRLHKRGHWLTMIQALRDGWSVRKTAKACRISIPTAFSWRHRFLRAIAGVVAATRTDEITEVDETYFRRSLKGTKSVKGVLPDGRKPRHRGGRARGRGLPLAQFVAVLVARDRAGRTFQSVLDGRRTTDVVEAALTPVLGPATVLCIDGGNALWGFVERRRLPFRIITPQNHVHETEPVFHLHNVNAFHRRLKDWTRQFNGVSTKYLGNYLAWFQTLDSKGVVQNSANWLRGCAGMGLAG